jgi:hypothetical protein
MTPDTLAHAIARALPIPRDHAHEIAKHLVNYERVLVADAAVLSYDGKALFVAPFPGGGTDDGGAFEIKYGLPEAKLALEQFLRAQDNSDPREIPLFEFKLINQSLRASDETESSS